MKSKDKKRECDIHGKTLFKHRENKKGEWWVCYECLKDQWKKAQKKRRKISSVREYQRKFNNDKSRLASSLSLTLRLLIFASMLKPE